MKYATKPQNISLAGAAVPPFDYIPYAFDNIIASATGAIALRTIDNRIVVIHLASGRLVENVGAIGLYPTGVNGTTIVDTATITVW